MQVTCKNRQEEEPLNRTVQDAVCSGETGQIDGFRFLMRVSLTQLMQGNPVLKKIFSFFFECIFIYIVLKI